MIEFIILGFLITNSLTGYDIKQKMSISTSNFIDASFGSIYPSLRRLKQKKLVSVEEIVENGKLKKVYSITELGKKHFMIWLKSPIEISKTNIANALSKIFFFNNLTTREATNSINEYIKDLTILRLNLLNVKDTLDNHINDFETCTLNFGIASYDFTIKWYKNYLESLNKSRGSKL